MTNMAFHERDFTKTTDVAEKPAPKPLLRRFLDALMESRQRAADREIARYIALNGGQLTDETERRIQSYLRDGAFSNRL